jgi:hypothetical protein
MDTETADRKSRTVSAKLNPEELDKLDNLALERGVARGYLIKELIQAGLEGRALLPLPPSMRGSIRDFGASEAGRAAIRRARNDAEAALNAGPAARKAGKSDA